MVAIRVPNATIGARVEAAEARAETNLKSVARLATRSRVVAARVVTVQLMADVADLSARVACCSRRVIHSSMPHVRCTPTITYLCLFVGAQTSSLVSAAALCCSVSHAALVQIVNWRNLTKQPDPTMELGFQLSCQSRSSIKRYCCAAATAAPLMKLNRATSLFLITFVVLLLSSSAALTLFFLSFGGDDFHNKRNHEADTAGKWLCLQRWRSLATGSRGGSDSHHQRRCRSAFLCRYQMLDF
jgi:hypothetical protein